ncbi:MAG: hypothetical protein WC325_13180, partial [Candidatus Bathyarchaeia archaeon]
GTELGLGEKVMMKTLGVKPEKPSLQVLEQSTIPTAPKEAFETVKVTELKATQEIKTPANLEGEIERLIINEPKIVEKTYLIENTTPESTRLIPKMQGNLQVADDLTMIVKGKEVVNPNTVLTGKSVESSEYYSISKPKADIIGESKLSFNKQTDPVTEFEAYSFKESSKPPVKSVAEPELSFSRPTMNFKELQANIKSGKIKSVDVIADLDVATGRNVQVEKSYGDYPWKGEDAKALLEKGSLVQAGKGKPLLVQQEKPFVDQLTSGKAAKATGVDKVLGDIQTGRAIDTARVSVSQKSINPFTSYAGRSYYGGRGGQVEESETQYLTLPGQVARLDSKLGVSSTGASGFAPPLTMGVSGFDVKPEPTVSMDSPKSVPIINPSIVPIVVPDIAPDIMPIVTPSIDEIVIPDIYQPPIPDQPQPLIPDQPQKTEPIPDIPNPYLHKGNVQYGLPPNSFKFEGGGYSLPSVLRGVSVRSRKKVYPILSGVEVLNLGVKQKHVKKTKKR